MFPEVSEVINPLIVKHITSLMYSVKVSAGHYMIQMIRPETPHDQKLIQCTSHNHNQS